MSETVEKLLRESLTFKKEMELVRERLERLESHRSDVSPAVYEKVHNEYASRLADIEGRLQKVQQPLDEEKNRLTSERQRIVRKIDYCNEQREELILRHKIGELAEEELRDKSAPLDQQRQSLNKELADVETALARNGLSPHAPITPPDYNDATDPRLDGTPSPPPFSPESSRPVLALYEEGKLLDKWMLEEATRIGRAPGNHIILKEPKISRHHATVEKQNDQYIIKDAGSSNGTFVNGEKISEQVLNPGDEVMIGDFKLTFETN